MVKDDDGAATPLATLAITAASGGVRFAIHAKPRAKRTKVVGVRDGALSVSLAAPPVEGAANDELVAYLARALVVPRREVALVRGEGSRAKLVEVKGLTVDDVRQRLTAELAREIGR